MAFPREIVEYINILQYRKNSKYASKYRRKFVRQLTILEHVGEPQIAFCFPVCKHLHKFLEILKNFRSYSILEILEKETGIY